MSGVCGKNSFRKTMCEEAQSNKVSKFRKSIETRVSTPLRENHLERTPDKDKFSK